MSIENLGAYPHEHTLNNADVIELFPRPESVIHNNESALKEAIVASGLAVAAIGTTVVISDLIDNELFTQVSLATVGTGAFLSLSYFTQPYFSNTKIGRRFENWAEPRRKLAEEKKLMDSKLSGEKREIRDLKRKIKKNSIESTGKKVKLHY